ncbi:hypothetical protein Q5752_005320 [Cryptotrichosporon argae]
MPAWAEGADSPLLGFPLEMREYNALAGTNVFFRTYFDDAFFLGAYTGSTTQNPISAPTARLLAHPLNRTRPAWAVPDPSSPAPESALELEQRFAVRGRQWTRMRAELLVRACLRARDRAAVLDAHAGIEALEVYRAAAQADTGEVVGLAYGRPDGGEAF